MREANPPNQHKSIRSVTGSVIYEQMCIYEKMTTQIDSAYKIFKMRET